MNKLSKSPNRIRQLRDARGLSVRALGEKAGINFNTVSKMERGTQPLDYPHMQKFARALDVKPSELLNDEDVELRASEEGSAILAALGNMPLHDRALVVQATREVVRVAQRISAQRSGATLAGPADIVADLAEVWNGWTDEERARGLALLQIAGNKPRLK